MNREELLYAIEDLVEKMEDENKPHFIELFDEVEELVNQLDPEGKTELIELLEESDYAYAESVIELCD